MDVHRCRFVPYPAAEINALAFSHPSNPNEPTPPQLRLALGRSNGDIEIWNPQAGSWVQETVLRGGKDRTIDGLAWTQDPESENADGKKLPGKLRLFSIGSSPVVTEWDLATGRPARQSGGTYGAVWCIAAQPAANSPGRKGKKGNAPSKTLPEQRQAQIISLGCEDGSVVLLSTADGDLTYLKTLPRSSGKKAKVISITWNGRDQVVAGYSDSMIRIYDITGRGRQITGMSLGAGGRGKSSETLVWNVKVLANRKLVSADSTGEIKIWDAKNYTLLQRIKGHLDADALSLATNYDGSLIFSGGMDRRTVLYQRSISEEDQTAGRWVAIHHQRNHQNDVKVMATFESKQLSIMVSGGSDAVPVVNPLRTFGQEHHRALPALTSSPVVRSAPQARLMISWWDREVSIWRFQSQSHNAELAESIDSEISSRKLAAHIKIQGEESITSASVNASGDLLVVCTISATKVFHLRQSKTTAMLRIQKIELPDTVCQKGSKLTQFSPDSKWLASALPDNSVQLVRLIKDQDAKQPYRVLDTVTSFDRRHGQPSQKVVWGTHGFYDHVITRLAWSSDNRVLVAGDMSGNLDTWLLEGNENPEWTGEARTNGISHHSHNGDDGNSSEEESDDEETPVVVFGQVWKRLPVRLPVLPAAPMVLSFRPGRTSTEPPVALVNGSVETDKQSLEREDRLLVVTAKHDVLEFHTLTGKLTNWSKRNPTSALPLAFRNVLDRTMDCVWDVRSEQQRVFLYGSTWIWMFDLSRDMPNPTLVDGSLQIVANDNASGTKRKRELTEVEKRQLIKSNAGAGSKIPEHERVLGAGAKLELQTGAGGNEVSQTKYESNGKKKSASNRDGEAESEEEEEDFAGFNDNDTDNQSDEDSDEEQNSALSKMRRNEGGLSNMTNGTTEHDLGGSAPHDWHTFKYRSILGIVPLQDSRIDGTGDEKMAKSMSSSNSGGIEVVIVERPLWDTDLRPRWEGPQEWGER